MDKNSGLYGVVGYPSFGSMQTVMQAWKEIQCPWRTFTRQPREIITRERGVEETIFGLPVSAPVIQMLEILRGM